MDIDFTTTLELVATGFTGWSDKKIILVSAGASFSSETQITHAPGFWIPVAGITALTAKSAGNTVDLHGTDSYKINFPTRPAPIQSLFSSPARAAMNFW